MNQAVLVVESILPGALPSSDCARLSSILKSACWFCPWLCRRPGDGRSLHISV